jgi:hypothetical protein
VTLELGHIGYADHALPQVEPGLYHVSAHLRMTADGVDETTPVAVQPLRIEGHRFQIPPDDVYSVHPAPGTPPGHAGTLPHIVFARTTLPWERRVDGASPVTTRPVEPWLALIVLSDADFGGAPPPAPEARSVSALVAPGAAHVRGPRLALDGIEAEGDSCTTIDLAMDLARRLLPRRDDLRWLAHVREVRTDHKETWSRLTDGRFAVLAANRLPPPAPAGAQARQALCLLVSLEGHAEVLDPASAPAETVLRLAVLGSWRFAVGPADPTAAALKALTPALIGPPTERLPKGPQGDAVAAHAAQGFVLLRHRTRVGAATASWYRGPLVPHDPARSDVDVVEVAGADRLLTWDPHLRTFETSRAAAWQLGRLLALQNDPVAAALVRFRREVARAMAAQAEAWAVYRAHADAPAPELAPLFPAAPAAPDRAAVRDAQRVPEEVLAFAARLALLYGVPLDYLLPHESLLPPDAIRFFHLDRWWVASALMGVLGVGRTRSGTTTADTCLREQVVDVIPRLVRGVRHDPPVEGPAVGGLRDWTVTGFVLRGPVVSAWLGLDCELRGRIGGREAPLVPLRIDRLQPDLMLCLCEGEITSVTIRQPPEALHFGATVEGGGRYGKSLRGRIGETAPRHAGDLVFDDRPGGAPGVLDVAALAAAIGARTRAEMTPAVLAHYMVDAPVQLTLSAAQSGAGGSA